LDASVQTRLFVIVHWLTNRHVISSCGYMSREWFLDIL